jgi:hypothetical protein
VRGLRAGRGPGQVASWPPVPHPGALAMKIPRAFRPLAYLAHEAGWTVEQLGSGQFRWCSPTAEWVYMSASPSDRLAPRKLRAALRRVCTGINQVGRPTARQRAAGRPRRRRPPRDPEHRHGEPADQEEHREQRDGEEHHEVAATVPASWVLIRLGRKTQCVGIRI